MSPYKYLFGFKIEVFADRLKMFQVPENFLERRFIREYLRKEIYIAMNEMNVLIKHYYDSKHRWEEFKIDDEI